MSHVTVIIHSVVFLAVALCVSEGLLRCSQVLLSPQPKFQLVRTCSLSQAAVIASGRLATFADCERLAATQRGLALNFVDPNDLEDENQDTCLIYDCPEFDPSLLHEDIDYDYYSIYTDIDLEINVTCVPMVGLFHLNSKPANFSEALSTCEWFGGQLASVTSSERTNHLSALVASLGRSKSLHFAYVGMHDQEQEGFFVTVADEPLNCFHFRGWAPGHPRARRPVEDCVVLDSRRSWRVVDCRIKLPFLCELEVITPDPCLHVRSNKWKQKCQAEADFNREKQRMNFQKCSHQYMDME
ncbi:uncharacterized protein LOC124365270 [Homalodisca vitripennis]|uniref:uncharacterized protein LOC124365270 n=1 Tax=Homalodisca vitripennis TaxID=197043 RepID=UPI001EEC5559|nr:uncharacterized protein LOC124365270 [Homalodisca vitripennis]